MTGQRQRRQRAALAVGLAFISLVFPGVASAHNAGRVELLVTNLKFSHNGPSPDSLTVSADLVDRDSGASAGGFAINVSARNADGTPSSPVTLTDPRSAGHYEGRLAVGPGSWTVTAKAEQGTSALPALGSTRVTTVEYAADGTVTQRGTGGGTTDLATWVALAGAALVLAVGALLVLTRKTAGPAVQQPVGQRV